MAIAVNDAGDVLTDTSGAWKPALRAVNDQTGAALALDGTEWKPLPANTGGQAPATPAMQSAPQPAIDTGAFARSASNIGEAGVHGAVEGFGNPIGETILSPRAQAWMDARQREGGVGGFLAGLGSTAAEDIGTAGGVVAAIPSAAFRGAQGVVAQTGAELGAPQLGRDIAAMPEAFMGGVPHAPIAPALQSAKAAVTALEVQRRDGVGIMEAWRRAHAENMGEAPAAAAIADIGKATNIDGAIAAFGTAVEAPADAIPTMVVRPTASELIRDEMANAGPAEAAGAEAPAAAAPAPITASQVQARDGVGYNEAVRRAATENAAGAPAPVPQSVGAAASRDMTSPAAAAGVSFGRTAREIKGQQADMELADLLHTPQPGDARDIIPGATQTKAEIEQTPTMSLEAKGLRQEFREGFNEHEQVNNELYHNWIDDVVPTAEMRGTMSDIRQKKWQDAEKTVFGPDPNGQPVSTEPVVQHLKAVFADPIEKSNSYLKNAFQPFLNAMTDKAGNPIVMGTKELYGLRQEMGRKVKDMATDTDLAHVRDQFGNLIKVTDNTITTGAPDYRAMMVEYREQSAPINAAERLGDIKLKITNGSDRVITFGQFDRYMKSLWAERNGPNPYAKAKDIPQATWDHLMLLHERLARSASSKELANAQGSDTSQMLMELARKGTIGVAHVAAAKLTGGLGNIAIPLITKQIDQARQQKRVRQHLNPDLSRYPTPGP
jgi:hypothetical protein